MTTNVLVLRPEADFARVGVSAPSGIGVEYRKPDDPELGALLTRSDALIIPAVGPKLLPDLFGDAALKLIQVTGAGVDRLDRAAVEKLGIPVANVPGGSNSALAEYATTVASTLLRRLAWSSAEIKRGNYIAFRARLVADNLAGLDGLKVGLVGLGIIGRAVAEAFLRFGCEVVFYDPALGGQAPNPPLAASPIGFDALLSTCDVVSLHVPLLPATRNLIGAAELARMKAGAILIHASRGGVVDEAALAAALTSGHLGGAAVDVYSTEPPEPANPLLTLAGEAAERLLLTPHIAGVTRQSAAYLFREAWDNVRRVVLDGKPPLHRVF
jgi:phosphoglycerate dehydrogenase-like enzyme